MATGCTSVWVAFTEHHGGGGSGALRAPSICGCACAGKWWPHAPTVSHTSRIIQPTPPVADVIQAAAEREVHPCLGGAVLAEVGPGVHLADQPDPYLLDLGVALVCCHGDPLLSLVHLAFSPFRVGANSLFGTGPGAQGGGSRSSDRCGIARRATARSGACPARSVCPGFIARRGRPGLEFAWPHPVGEKQCPPGRHSSKAAQRPEVRLGPLAGRRQAAAPEALVNGDVCKRR
jgi:hypothetical protein